MKKRRAFILLGLLILMIIGFMIANNYISRNKRSLFRSIEDSNEYAYQIEDAAIVGENLVIKGWFFELESVRNTPRKIEKNNTLGVVLYDINNNQLIQKSSSELYDGIKCYVERNERKDIKECFDSEHDHSGCGFTAKIDKKMIDFENGKYLVVLKSDQDHFDGINTGIYIDKGVLKKEACDDIYPLFKENKELENVVNNWHFLGASPDYFVCAFQNYSNIYFIVNEELFPEKDSDIRFQCILDTTQIDRLPEEYTENNKYYYEIKGVLSECDLIEGYGLYRYRGCKISIPENRGIYWISFEYLVDGKWHYAHFRPT